MNESYEFLKLVLDAITEHIVVIDENGEILFVNRSWSTFGENNSCVVDDQWNGVNYLGECDKAAAMGDDFGTKAAKGIREVISSDKALFYFEYPCHSPEEKRWFIMRVTPFEIQGSNCFVISHQNITERKLAEERLFNLSRIDGLTNIPNRTAFDEFLQNEWARCSRLKLPLSLALIDLDHFKDLNDTYGHQAGDKCLKKFSGLLKTLTKRPSDICARYGGEEFAIIYGNTTLDDARELANKLLVETCNLGIPNKKSPTMNILTTSIGLATMLPNKKSSKTALIKKADEMLYKAKESGRNRVSYC